MQMPSFGEFSVQYDRWTLVVLLASACVFAWLLNGGLL